MYNKVHGQNNGFVSYSLYRGDLSIDKETPGPVIQLLKAIIRATFKCESSGTKFKLLSIHFYRNAHTQSNCKWSHSLCLRTCAAVWSQHL